MIELYRGKINLKDPSVSHHALLQLNKPWLLDPTKPHYERQIEKFMVREHFEHCPSHKKDEDTFVSGCSGNTAEE